MIKKVILLLLTTSISMHAFSYKEVDALPYFALQSPRYYISSDGQQLAYYPFGMNDEVKDIVVMYHGATLYSNRMYQWVARELQTMNIATVLVDIRGHGYSGGIRGDAPSVERMYEDVHEIMHHIKRQYPQACMYAAGHSSGAGLLLNYIEYKQFKAEEIPFQGLLLLAPYLGPNSGCARYTPDQPECFAQEVRTWVYILNALSGGYLCKHFRAVTFRYPEHVLRNDSLIVPTQTCALSCAMSPYDPQTIFKKLSIPFMLFVGSDDEQLIAEKTISFAHLSDSAVNKRAVVVEGAKHLSLLVQVPSLIAQSLNCFNE